MIQKLPKPPTTQRAFANAWAELDYLCKKVRYWLYSRRERSAAMHFADRLARVLRELPNNGVAILRVEGLALISELEGNVADAIAHRRREIKLMERLHREARSPKYSEETRSYMLQDRDGFALNQRREILDSLEKTKDGRNG